MPCRWYPSIPCSRFPGGAIPACLVTGLQGGLLGGLPAQGGLLLGGLLWGVCFGGLLLGGGGCGDPPKADGYCCEQYASYWNAFLLTFSVEPLLARPKMVMDATL